jgi:hypothetical protein
MPSKTMTSLNETPTNQDGGQAGGQNRSIDKNLGTRLPTLRPKKEKWTRFIERLEQHTMGEEAGLAFDEGRKEFREHF